MSLAAFDRSTQTWSAVGGGLTSLGSPGQGRALVLDGDRLYVGGYFDVAGGYWNESTFAVIESLGAIASEAGISLPELSLRWLPSKAVVTSVLLGGSKPQQLEANISAAQAGPLPDDVIAACDGAGLALAGSMPGYNR